MCTSFFVFKIFEALTFDDRSECINVFYWNAKGDIYDLYLTLGTGRGRKWEKQV